MILTINHVYKYFGTDCILRDICATVEDDDRIGMIGGGRHMRLRLRSGRHSIPAIYFSATAESASIVQGDMVDVAFYPQVNDFRGERSVQLNIQDVRPSCRAECSLDTAAYQALRAGRLDAATAAARPSTNRVRSSRDRTSTCPIRGLR